MDPILDQKLDPKKDPGAGPEYLLFQVDWGAKNWSIWVNWAQSQIGHFLALIKTQLDFALAESRILGRLATQGSDYWVASSNDRLALAKGSTVEPTSPYSPAIFRSNLEEGLPEVHEILCAGGRVLELGSGVGGGLIALIRAYPKTTGVGVELAGDLLEEARQSIAFCDLEDRITLHNEDASTFDAPPQAFVLARWSQFYFPEASRAATLRVAYRALKPGGFLVAPCLAEPSILDTNLRSEVGKRYSLGRAYYRAWGVPELSGQDLQNEIEEAGFISPRLISRKNKPGFHVLVQRPDTAHDKASAATHPDSAS